MSDSRFITVDGPVSESDLAALREAVSDGAPMPPVVKLRKRRWWQFWRDGLAEQLRAQKAAYRIETGDDKQGALL